MKYILGTQNKESKGLILWTIAFFGMETELSSTNCNMGEQNGT